MLIIILNNGFSIRYDEDSHKYLAVNANVVVIHDCISGLVEKTYNMFCEENN